MELQERGKIAGSLQPPNLAYELAPLTHEYADIIAVEMAEVALKILGG
jgi:hypothetical protein